MESAGLKIGLLRVCLGGVLLGVCLWLPLSGAAATDVRILIDVSGSMKQNDRSNLRVPALRLVSELLPAGARAGVWLFGEDATTLIAPGTVDDAWRVQARAQVPQIHSRGLFTHIERALDAATTGWESEAEHGERHIVLLTDGMVDVSKTPAESTASRARVLGAQLERLRAFGARVHAVALSNNVDQELLDALTATTGGLLETADTAERLQRIFLYMLEQTAAPVTVPLEGKQFQIDASVSELTLLIFRGDGEVVRLVPPSGEAYDATTAPAGVTWRSETGYDLITVRQPLPGQWRFEGTEDPDNRAVVVTDLALAVDSVPGMMMSSETVDFDAWLTEATRPIDRLDFLQLARAQVRIESAAMAPAEGDMPLNAERLRYEGRLDGRALPVGDYQLTVSVDGGSFKRAINRRIRIGGDPLRVNYGEQPGETGAVGVEVVADAELIDPSSMSGYLTVTDATGLVRAFPLPEAVGGVVRSVVTASAAGAHEFAPHIYFTTRYGRTLHIEPTPRSFELAFAAMPEEEVAVTEEEPAPQSDFSWLAAGSYIAIGNLLIGLGLGAIGWAYRRPRGAAAAPPAAEAQAA